MGQWTAKIADRIQVRPGDRVLDVACGTGVFARAVVSRVGPSGSVSPTRYPSRTSRSTP
jgi:ubiquinone/menaquinone biosynthesis C-methylase UbiE